MALALLAERAEHFADAVLVGAFLAHIFLILVHMLISAPLFVIDIFVTRLIGRRDLIVDVERERSAKIFEMVDQAVEVLLRPAVSNLVGKVAAQKFFERRLERILERMARCLPILILLQQ
ncbi:MULTISPECIES: hypothetical protein [unclassified Sphingomonas]|uniref:hypothetical protein n=1 Tax=unclassified Sphingomonas TaxID=196159 RepID=UPI00285842C8|nr:MULTISPECIES: hypothetical protein [unclassified Sphingomonas]MDR6116265.1 hypothetical protein [Sphingomonas sp. SORGH_AS_0789]MDR6150060.1 hypothetical protein [Sphingomonas sp. SORGH_AS_0742]